MMPMILLEERICDKSKILHIKINTNIISIHQEIPIIINLDIIISFLNISDILIIE